MPTLRLRNPIARSPLLRKGGTHIKSKSSQRTQAKKEIKKMLTDFGQK